MEEVELIKKRYERRKSGNIPIYSYLHRYGYMSKHEREKKLMELLRRNNITDLSDKTLLEIGCGHGGNLLQMIRYGFKPQNIYGIELMDDRAFIAKKSLPNETTIIHGDALEVELDMKFDIVYQSTVFTSVLDSDLKKQLANRMWHLTKSGGVVLWYDFTYNNPKNPDVKGVKLKEIRSLFPEGKITSRKVTLAPPIGRMVTKIHPFMYTLFNCLPFLRTHRLCWIEKE